MLDTLIAKMGALFFGILFLLFMATGIMMLMKWYMVINQAQATAALVGKFGGYTEVADNAMREFASDIKADASSLDVQIGPRNSGINLGEAVTCNITYNFRMSIGSVLSVDVPLTGRGRSVCSAFDRDRYGITYTVPSY